MGLGRFEAWARLGRIRTAETTFAEASLAIEEHEWRNRIGSDPHGAPWYSSFHASRFPGDDPRACGRMLAYELIGAAQADPFSRMLRGTMIVGQAAEDWNVGNLDFDGRLLTPPATADHQLRFEAADHWLTGSPDIIILPKGWNRPHLIETKTKDLEVVVEMKNLNRTYDAKHARQTRCGIGLGNHISQKLWPKVWICRDTWRLAEREESNGGVEYTYRCRDHGHRVGDRHSCVMQLELEPLRTGSLLYMGRDRPHVTCEYVFEHDEQWFQKGLATLVKVRKRFEAGELPPHPFGGKGWSELPCKYCDYKKHSCKPDHKAGITKLAETKGAEFSREVYGSYDIDQIMQSVIDRWSGETGYRGVMPPRHDDVQLELA